MDKQPGLPAPEKIVGIVSINREEWLITDLACNMLGVTSVPLYDTLSEEMVS